MSSTENLTPWQIVQKLDKYIIGQKEAKKKLAIAQRNRWRRAQTPSNVRKDISPNNILMIGPTGSGKTECARQLANITDNPFIKVEATRFTEIGYKGSDVNEIIRSLVQNAFNMVKKNKQQEVKEKANKQVEETILDTLIPRAISNSEESTTPSTATQQDNEGKKDMNQATRDRFREKLQKGELNEYKIEIHIKTSQNPVNAMGFVGGEMDESTMMNLESMFNKLIPQTVKKKKVTIQEARKILLEEKMNNLLDIESIKEEAIQKTENQGIVFIDEIDKIATSTQKNSGPDVSREGVQRDLLPIVEGSTVQTKYGSVNTDHILFIAAGAFHTTQPSDLLPEFQGRFPIRVKLDSLTKKDFERILKEPVNSLLKQQEALCQAEGVTLTFQQEAITAIAHFAFEINQTMQNIGARRLRTVLSHLLSDFLYDIPEKIQSGQIIDIDEKTVQQKIKPLVEHQDHKSYIL